MLDDLIQYYQRELAFLRNAAGAFADAHPKIASRLRLTREAAEDPHIGRLIESVAFMNARLRHKIDDEFPEISDALLMALYPHLIEPVPSFFIARLAPGPELDKPTVIPRGTMLTTEAVNGEPCRYRLCGDTILLPLRIADTVASGPPFEAPSLVPGAKGVLRISLAATGPDANLAKLELDRIRLFICSDPRRAQILLEQIGANLLGVGVASAPDDPRAVLLDRTAVRLMGFEADELLLPQSPVASLAYASVQEYFAFPHKHLFFEISGLAARTLTISGARLELYLYFDRLSPELERLVRPEDFELFAAPAINLFEMEAEPIQLDHSRIDYRIVPDSRREDALEVHSIVEVELQDALGERRGAPALYLPDHGSRQLGRFFHATSRRSSFAPGGGDDVLLAIADLEGHLLTDDNVVVSSRVRVTNRDLPSRLPFGGGRPLLTVADPPPGLAGVSAITKPTPTRRPQRRRAAAWKTVSQLSLNYLSFTGGKDGAASLREVLALYDLGDSPETSSLRERLVGVSGQPGVARARLKGHAAFCAGVDVLLEVDDERLSGSGAYLMCEVIEHFLATACAINSFVRLTARLRREPGPWKTWAPRVGDRPLV